MACSAPNCSNNLPKGFRTFRFPSDPARKAIWVQNCQRDKWLPNANSRLCIAHFDESQFESSRKDGRKKLKPNAIPTIFNIVEKPKKPKFESCVFRECKNRNVKLDESSERAQLLFFPFPTDPRLKQAWLRAATVTPEVRKGSGPKICSEHFFPQEFEVDESGRIQLKPYAIPIVFNTTIVEEELAPKRKRPRKSKELIMKPSRVVIPMEERWAADARLIQLVEEETEGETLFETTRSLASSFDCGETESLPNSTSPTPPRSSCGVPLENPNLPSLQLLSYVAAQALEDVEMEMVADAVLTGDQIEDSSSPNKRKRPKISCSAIQNFIAQASKQKSSLIKSRHLIIKEKNAGSTNEVIDPTSSLPSVFIFDGTIRNPPGGDSSSPTTKTSSFDTQLEKMSIADVEAKHTGVRLKISTLTTRNDALLREVQQLKITTKQLILQIRRCKDEITKYTENNLLVVETVPRCDCRKNRGSDELPREDLDAVFGDVASREIPSPEECQLHIAHQERLIKRINDIKSAFQARGKDIVRVVVIQSEDLKDGATRLVSPVVTIPPG